MQIQSKLLFTEDTINKDILDEDIFTEPHVLWEGKTTVKPNIWGLNTPVQGLRFHNLYGSSYASPHRMGHLGIILWSAMLFPIWVGLWSCLSTLAGIIGGIFYIGAVLYWVLFREIKYYRLTKTTRYKITKTEVQFVNKIFTKPRTLNIPIHEIKQIHLVPFNSEGMESGSIYLYLDRRIKTYNLTDMERSYKLVIERVEDFRSAYQILQGLIS